MAHLRTAAALLLVVALVGCAGGDGAAPDAPDEPADAPADEAGAAATLTIADFAFATSPVAPGATVEVTNEDGASHTVTAEDGSFDLTVEGGATGTFTAPDSPGSYAFACSIHPTMTGALEVA